MRFVAALLLLPVWSLAHVAVAGRTNSQVSTGNCSPNIVSSGSGSVTIQLLGSCSGVDPRMLSGLTQSLQKFLAQLPKTVGNLNDLLDKKNVELGQKKEEIEDWIRKYNELSHQLEQQPADDTLSKQAAEALRNGDFARAESLLKDLLAKEEKQVDLTARNQFNLAQLLELRFDPVQALTHYQKAYNYRPNNPRYGQAYAGELYNQRRFKESEAVYANVLQIRRDLAQGNPQAYLPDMATTLNHLGVLYSNTQRLREAADAYTEALQTYRNLAKANQQSYLPEWP
jgi:tetratricopeptide (TPR) repeat protein